MNHIIIGKRILFAVAGFLLASGPATRAITIGQGPAIGTDKRGTTWYEEFQDWGFGDGRALDPNADHYLFGNAFQDPARDIIAFYSHDDGNSVFFRVDFFDLQFGSELGEVDVYVAIDCAGGGQVWLPDFMDAQTSNPWELCIGVYNSVNASVYDTTWNNIVGTAFLGAYWRSDLDAVEFGITRQSLLDAGWDGSSVLQLQVFTTRDGTDGGPGEIPGGSDIVDHIGTLTRDVGDGTGLLSGTVPSNATVGRAKYAAIAHANQSLSTKGNTQGHIYTDRSDINLHPGFIRTIESHEMLGAPLNMHLSGSLISSLLWATQNPGDGDYPARDGPTFLARLKSFVDSGVGSLVGGVYAEHIMPYFEGEANLASIDAFNELALEVFDLTTDDMKVMHVPERVIHTDTNAAYVSSSGILQGKPFEDILEGGYEATYLDEVTHLHWWFYAGETSNAGWDDAACGRWAGGQGNDEETYHHKVHKINGVYSFMINDREDQSKFGPDDGGMQRDTRYTLLDKARQSNYGQITIVFDDWEAFAGNSFASSTPNNNAEQWHDTIRWAANHPWIEIVNLKEVLGWAKADEVNWVIDHGFVYDKSVQTYEWLKRASEQSYDKWYYGDSQEENFFGRIPNTAPGGSYLPGTKNYGDLNTPGTLLHDAWQTVTSMPAGNLRDLAEWTYSAMIYETAWHDEDANPDQYKSRNYQVTFNRGPAEGNCDTSVADTTWDPTAGWALKLQGHARKVGVHADAVQWVADIIGGAQGEGTVSEAKDVDDDLYDEYILKNNKVYLCFERWGARLVSAFVYDPMLQDAYQVIGAPVANPANEHDGEEADNVRVSAFKDRYTTGTGDNRYVDQDFVASPPIQGTNYWDFLSADGQIQKRITLEDGRDAARGDYTLGGGIGLLYTRFGLGPNQRDLLRRGPANLLDEADSTYRGLRNTSGGAAYVVAGQNVGFVNGSLDQAGWDNRELPMMEQFETVNSSTAFSVWLAFSPASALDIDGDGLSNEDEIGVHGTNHELADTDMDGMDDGYEILHGLLAGVDDATDDKDMDGSDNLGEFLANTLASDSNSFFRLTDVRVQPGQAEIDFTTAPDRTYQIFFADIMGADTQPMWMPFSDLSDGIGTYEEISGMESNRTLVDDYSGATSGGQSPAGVREYRVDVLAP